MDDSTAVNFLTSSDWKIETAINNYYENPDQYYVAPSPLAVDRKKLDSLFNKYRGRVASGR